MQLNPEIDPFPLDLWCAGIRMLCRGPVGAAEVYEPASRYLSRKEASIQAKRAEQSRRLAGGLDFLHKNWRHFEKQGLVQIDSSKTPIIGDRLAYALHTAVIGCPTEEFPDGISVELVMALARDNA
jgi:hypothetical protein